MRRGLYLTGEHLQQSADELSLQIASPAKVLCDHLLLTRNQPRVSRTTVRWWVLEDLYLDPDLLSEINLNYLSACLASGFRRRQLTTLGRRSKPCSGSWPDQNGS